MELSHLNFVLNSLSLNHLLNHKALPTCKITDFYAIRKNLFCHSKKTMYFCTRLRELCKQEKHCDKVLSLKIRQNLKTGGRSRYAFACCVCWLLAYRQAWDLFHGFCSCKGVWRYLNENGHEYINLMPFFLGVFIILLEVWEQTKRKEKQAVKCLYWCHCSSCFFRHYAVCYCGNCQK